MALSQVHFYLALRSDGELDSKNANRSLSSARTGPFLWSEALELVPNTSMAWLLQTQVRELTGLQLHIESLHVPARTPLAK